MLNDYYLEGDGVTSLEMMHLYEGLVRASYIKFYKISKNSKRVFKRLKIKLEEKEIDPEDFIRVQFQFRGNRPFPNQLISKFSLDRYETYNDLRDVKGLHYQQETYLERFIDNGYTVEEALSIPIFYYYFRCMIVDDYPSEWDTRVRREIENTPSLKILIEERSRMTHDRYAV
jgi:hypothetical protein